jgi:diaminohydroxyphosphoribosylaminopyrimidine deaminase / 5-amino-6-(5-phosphoribosylamino)uracil reductase
MQVALSLARRAVGRAWPNPAVGCILVRDGHAVGRGWTGPGGRPHAETEALGRAGAAAQGATAYVTLEPCAHHGATPPCADALIAAGVARAVIAVEDPDPRVRGRGLARLRAAAVEVAVGREADAAAGINAGFFRRIGDGRPNVTLKVASSLDGCIAAASGDSRWITGETARAVAHGLRARHDAVLIGSETALADDPELTCRLAGLAGASPLRIVLDGRLRLPLECRLVRSVDRVPLWVFCREDAAPEKRRALADRGVDVIAMSPGDAPHLDPRGVLSMLGDRGLTRVLVEGGGRIAAAFLSADLIDEIAWFRAPLVLGAGGVPSVAALAVSRVADATRFDRREFRRLDDDLLETFVRTR